MHLVGHANPSLWNVISCLHKDSAITAAEEYRYKQGELVAAMKACPEGDPS
ncbi:hypothetical protein DPMN_116323 [Dreissena polymorpha]|uniref:Uncharacterized protein n=1 Tax=Dreissena polymorpha TaxID=45954 RepID=A0A9D4QTG0_DREPO|nr:hypothetical protein DPMN_116323 [Dreissena polymorpha]